MIRKPLETESTEPITEQDNELLARHKEYKYMSEKMTWDPNCYECKVRYRDPKAKDLVMYLHAWRYKVFNFFREISKNPDFITVFSRVRTGSFKRDCPIGRKKIGHHRHKYLTERRRKH